MNSREKYNLIKFVGKGVIIIVIIYMVIKSGFRLDQINIKSNRLEINICGNNVNKVDSK